MFLLKALYRKDSNGSLKLSWPTELWTGSLSSQLLPLACLHSAGKSSLSKHVAYICGDNLSGMLMLSY